MPVPVERTRCFSFVKAMSAVVFDTSKTKRCSDFIFPTGSRIPDRTRLRIGKEGRWGKRCALNTVNILSNMGELSSQSPEKGKTELSKERSADAEETVSRTYFAVGKYIASARIPSDFSRTPGAVRRRCREWRHEGATMVQRKFSPHLRMEKSFKIFSKTESASRRVPANAVESALSSTPRGGNICRALRCVEKRFPSREETRRFRSVFASRRFINDETGCMSLLGHMSRTSSGKRPRPGNGEERKPRERLLHAPQSLGHASTSSPHPSSRFWKATWESLLHEKKTPREMPDNEKAFFKSCRSRGIEDEDETRSFFKARPIYCFPCE